MIFPHKGGVLISTEKPCPREESRALPVQTGVGAGIKPEEYKMNYSKEPPFT